MRITSTHKLNLERFGCTFGGGIFSINWKGKRSSQATTAGIFACLGRVDTNSGPIVLLAFEISAIRPLPSYCYFPFDLNNPVHRTYLSRLTKQGELKFRFLTNRGIYTRNHRLTPYLCLRATEVLAEAVRLLGTIEKGKYNFDGALSLMERHVRIPEFLNRLLLEDTVGEISQRISEAVKTVPTEDREFATAIVNQVAGAFTPYYRNNRKTILEYLHNAPRGFAYINDLHRIFVDNPAGLTEFLRDGLAASFTRKELEAISELGVFILSFSSLFRQDELTPQSESLAKVPELPFGLADLVHSMKISGISKDSGFRFLKLIGLEVGGRPGRPTKDYSREYELKKSLSWTNVTRQRLQDNLELRDEFDGRYFDSLNFEEQENLKNRIREGVRSYAERTGRPYPIGSEDEPD